MKTLVSGFISLALFSNVSFASTHDVQTDLEIQAMALVQLSQQQAVETNRLAGIGDVISGLGDVLKQIEELKDGVIAQFDENGNGRIDPGPELDNFKQTIHDVVMLLADSNQNGKIDFQDIKVLTQFVLDQAKTKALELGCPTVIKEAEKAGWWLQFRPVLKHFYEICTFGV